jgi:hypothetical protein
MSGCSQHAKVDEWRQQLADQQARLDRACLRMADAHADAPEGYKKHRTTYCKVGGIWSRVTGMWHVWAQDCGNGPCLTVYDTCTHWLPQDTV